MSTESNMFDFMDSNSKIDYPINENINLVIKRSSHAIAIVYFTDKDNNQIDIPNEIKIYTFDDKNRVLQKPADKQNYALCWTDNYVIYFDINIILNINNVRQWNITGISPWKTGRFLTNF